MVIAMVSGVLTFVQSLGVVLGANMYNSRCPNYLPRIEQYVPLLMFAGLLLFVGKTNTLKKLGIILLGFGLMFYGLEAIDEA